MVDVHQFFDSLLEEITLNKQLQGYYRFLQSKKMFPFRKAYYLQRLEFIQRSVEKENASIWDCGCGYGTTDIFLALNGHKVYGNTLEYYYEAIEGRLPFWSNIGDVSQLSFDYSNLFDAPPPEKFDYIIVQDTLHHLEPIDKALAILNSHLHNDGKIIVVEENGRNLIQRAKLFKQRGNKRIISIYDERLKKEILLGNENTRSLEKWELLFYTAGLQIDDDSVTYNRLFFPGYYHRKNRTIPDVLTREKFLSTNRFLRNFFFFGLNFTASKKNN